MKKLLFTALAVLAFGAINAQDGGFSKGNLFVSGALTVGTSEDKNFDEKTTDFVIEPKVGYFVTDKIAIGGKLGFGSSKFESQGSTEFEASSFTVGGFGRYYFTPANKFSLFAELAIDYTNTDLKSEDYKLNGVAVGLGLGLNYFVSNNFAIEAYAGLLGFTTEKPDFDGAEATNSFVFGGDWRNGAVGIGVLYRF